MSPVDQRTRGTHSGEVASQRASEPAVSGTSVWPMEEPDNTGQSTRRLVVLGGAGYVGRNILSHLKNLADELVVVDPLMTEADSEFTSFDSLSDVPFRLSSEDVVLHLAAKTNMRGGITGRSTEVSETVAGLSALLDEADRLDFESPPRILYFSSSAVYGSLPAGAVSFEESDPWAPQSMYGAAKCSAEALLSAYYHSFGIESVVFRPSTIVGGLMDRGVMPALIHQAKTHGNVTYLGDGSQRRSFLHTEDLAKAVAIVLRAWPEGGAVYNVGAKGSTSVKRVGEIISELSGCPVGPSGEPSWAGDAALVELNTTRIESLGWRVPTSEQCARRAIEDLWRADDLALRSDEER